MGSNLGCLHKMVNWLDFTSKMSIFGDNLKFFGDSILKVAVIISALFFWFIVFTFYQPYKDIAVLMIDILRMGVFLFIVGFIFNYFFFFLNELIHKSQMKKIKINVNGKNK